MIGFNFARSLFPILATESFRALDCQSNDKVNNRTGREVTVAEPTLHPLAEKCCPSLLISSPGLALQVGLILI